MTEEYLRHHYKRDLLTFDAHIDDLGLTPEAMRVYVHLMALMRSDEEVNIDMEQIGSHCFGSLSKRTATTTKKADKAMQELCDAGLLSYENDTWTVL